MSFINEQIAKNNIQSKSFTTVSALSISAIGMIMVLGFSTTAPLGIAFAQTDNATMTGTTTTTASSNPSNMMGVIASMQLDSKWKPGMDYRRSLEP